MVTLNGGAYLSYIHCTVGESKLRITCTRRGSLLWFWCFVGLQVLSMVAVQVSKRWGSKFDHRGQALSRYLDQ